MNVYFKSINIRVFWSLESEFRDINLRIENFTEAQRIAKYKQILESLGQNMQVDLVQKLVIAAIQIENRQYLITFEDKFFQKHGITRKMVQECIDLFN